MPSIWRARSRCCNQTLNITDGERRTWMGFFTAIAEAQHSDPADPVQSALVKFPAMFVDCSSASSGSRWTSRHSFLCTRDVHFDCGRAKSVWDGSRRTAISATPCRHGGGVRDEKGVNHETPLRDLHQTEHQEYTPQRCRKSWSRAPQSGHGSALAGNEQAWQFHRDPGAGLSSTPSEIHPYSAMLKYASVRSWSAWGPDPGEVQASGCRLLGCHAEYPARGHGTGASARYGPLCTSGGPGNGMRKLWAFRSTSSRLRSFPSLPGRTSRSGGPVRRARVHKDRGKTRGR